MTREQSLAREAINAGKYLGPYWGRQYTDLESAGTLATRTDVRSVDIPRATTVNTASQLVIGLHKISDDRVIVGYCPPSYSPKIKELTSSLPVTNSISEIPGYTKSAIFDELQKLRADETRFRAALGDLRSLKIVREREPILNRLEALLEDFQSDYGRCLDADSLRTFIALLSRYPKLRRPIITAAENGNLVVEWKTEDGKHFLGVQMLPTHQVRYVATRPDAKHPHIRIHSSGVTSVDELFVDLASYEILTWACTA